MRARRSWWSISIRSDRRRGGTGSASPSGRSSSILASAVSAIVIGGSAETVLDKLVAFRDEVGPFGTLLMTGHDWDDKALWQASMRRLARDVMPRFGQHAGSDAVAE